MNPSSFGITLLVAAAACGGSAALPGPVPAGPGAVVATHLPAVRFRAGDRWRAVYTRADTFVTTLPNGGQQRQAIDRTLMLQWSVTAAPSGLALVVTIDSARIVGLPGSVERAMEDSARGAVIRGVLRTDGGIDSLTSLPDAAVVHALIAELPWLSPPLGRAGGSDAEWSDTLPGMMRLGALDLTERTIRHSSVTASENTLSVTMSGAVDRDGMNPQVHITGTGTRVGSATVEPNGRIRTAAGRDSVLMSAMVEAMGQSVQILQLGGYTLTALP